MDLPERSVTRRRQGGVKRSPAAARACQAYSSSTGTGMTLRFSKTATASPPYHLDQFYPETVGSRALRPENGMVTRTPP